ncbi:hypothetical protein [Echinicola strongylocentroti]|uniref:hypothetical protein n=1 Tax=Echinicola strongylocentroti TaxID=1795355 RepID=UPI0013A6A5C9|nr:hypothetical protein [Echinicola strongylocentroti]
MKSIIVEDRQKSGRTHLKKLFLLFTMGVAHGYGCYALSGLFYAASLFQFKQKISANHQRSISPSVFPLDSLLDQKVIFCK